MWNRFKDDALRWVVPGQIADPAVLSWWLLLKLLYRHLPLRAMAWYRFACWTQQRRIPLLYGIITRHIYLRHGLEIWGDIGGGLYIPHPVGTVIAVETMGQNCSVIAAVTVGMREKWGFPQIGDDVFIGAGARVLGTITVGSQAKIGANSVVLGNVPAAVTVVGAPARVVTAHRKQGPNGTRSNGSLRESAFPPKDLPESRRNGEITPPAIAQPMYDKKIPLQVAIDDIIDLHNLPK